MKIWKNFDLVGWGASHIIFLFPFLQMVNTPTSVTKFFLKLFQDVKDYREATDMKHQDFTQVLLQLHKQGYLTNADCNGNDIKATRKNLN